MAPSKEQSSLKRARASQGNAAEDIKKPRRSERISSHHEHEPHPRPGLKDSQYPSPITQNDTSVIELAKEGTRTPPEGRPSQINHHSPPSSPGTANGLKSPPDDTQPFSQVVASQAGLSSQVESEVQEQVWGYLIPLDSKFGPVLVLRSRGQCPISELGSMRKDDGAHSVPKNHYKEEEKAYEECKVSGVASRGYLIGRHPECDRVLEISTISNRHCLIYRETKGGAIIAVLEDLSSNGTYVNEALVGRNKWRELKEGDEIAVLDKARFVFRYPRTHNANGFDQQYHVIQQLGKGHFATVYLAVEKKSGIRYAVKKFDKQIRSNVESKALEGLQQEIGVLMGVSHPNVLCLKDTFDEFDGIHLVLELAPEGELFNCIVSKGKLTEVETRKLFIQLFQGLKYLHERNIVHRDIKPENILLIDKEFHVKLADFGLAKIIGEDSFTTTLCGTPSYVAPEVLQNTRHRRYTKAVDIWSLGVVLYICLCGFPPFSEELNTPDHPYSLMDQIKNARFDYPSPYWDSVSDLALDLIDKMLTVGVKQRIDIDGCLEHPWTTLHDTNPHISMDSTDGLTGAMNGLDFSKRKPQRERTLLSSWNSVRISNVLPPSNDDNPEVKVFRKNGGATGAKQSAVDSQFKNANPENFVHLGQHEDEPLFGDDPDSQYHKPQTKSPPRA